ncbi:hypothetical protein Q8W71_06800 [Methylobacterium sp. NEAU 140]|uniref:hypothetical protein n=1 Tax=Methylobacterium sp. NEAU 140 TaxID=3064945 RepID=UPI00273465EB|nr:hypothetical protein [Methylobacterium sp. NEAU 140]MDP4022325.1 hypothetical protein [Methylobacterium sp. NEAU 140]
MPSLTLPLIAACVFTIGGYVILRLERQAEPIGDGLFAAFAILAMVTGALALGRVAAPPHSHARAASSQGGPPPSPALPGRGVFSADAPVP